jgi:NhaP-type Na+/H+ or K+/H+ antiporter
MAISLAIIIILGLGADYLFRRVKLPGLLGMLLVGILVGPYGLHLLRPQMMAVSADFREIALIVILLRAGFELRRDTLNRTARPTLLMGFVPALFEITAITLAATYFFSFSWLQAALLGVIIGSVSPAVVVPLMIHFMEQGRGTQKGIPTFILAGSALDNVFAIVVFTQLLSLYQGHRGSLLWCLENLPIAIGTGILLGLAAGFLLHWLLKRYEFANPRPVLLVLGAAIVLAWVGDMARHFVIIASLLGVLTMGLVILERDEGLGHLISQKLKGIWVLAEMLLFVLVGAQVNPKVAWGTGMAGLAIIGLGLAARALGSFLAVSGLGLTLREKLFAVVAYIPKATVQAAIGAIPLEAGVPGGEIILALAVLSILLTAPLGAIGITWLGERVLDREERNPYRFKTLREQLHLPRVGQQVRNKLHGRGVWKVIEEKEVWVQTPDGNGDPGRLLPAIYLRFWKPPRPESSVPGKGRTLSYRYTPEDHSFTRYWEILGE